MKTLKLLCFCVLYLLVQSCSKKENSIIPKTPPNLSSAKHSQWSYGDVPVNGVYWFKNPNGNTFQVGSSTAGALVQENSYVAYTNQQWELTNVGGYNFFKIINHYSGLAMSVVGSSKSQNAQIDQETYTGAANQLWLVVYLGYVYEIWNANSGLALTIPGDVTTQFTDLTQTTYVGDNAHWWEPTLISSLGTNTTYYVSNSTGSDSNNGLTQATAWKTLTHASAHTYAAGNWLLLKSGDTWTGATALLNLKGSGTALNPILLSSYGTGNRPVIAPGITDTACVYLKNVAGWQISNLDLSAARDGICANYDQVYNSDYLLIENCNIHDFTNTYNSKPNLFNHWSNGVLLEGYAPAGTRQVALTNFAMHDCTFTNCNRGFNGMCTPFYRCSQTSGFSPGALVQMQNFTIQNCTATTSGQGAFGILSGNNGTVTNFDSNNNGLVANQYGSAAFVISYCQNITFDGCDMTNNYRGPQAYDGEGFDFEGGTAPDGTNQHNITLQNCSIVTSDGSAILMFDNGAGHPSTNCTVNNVTITNYGQNVGNVSQGIYFASGTTGTISNCTFNRNNSYAYLGGTYTGFTFTNDVYH